MLSSFACFFVALINVFLNRSKVFLFRGPHYLFQKYVQCFFFSKICFAALTHKTFSDLEQTKET